MATAVKTFKAKDGGYLTDKDAQVAGEFLVSVFDGEPFEAADVVEAARPGDSALHGFFIWDDQIAAAEHRLNQARWLVRSITYSVVTDEGESGPTRAFHYVTVTVGEDEQRSGYVQSEVVWSSAPLAEQVVAKAERELRSWAARYREYEALAGHVEAIERGVLPLFADGDGE